MGQKDITENNSEDFLYKITDNILSDVCYIIDSSQKLAFNAINIALIQRNWYLGKRIAGRRTKRER